MMGNVRLYLFEMPDETIGYLPAVPVVRDYFRHARRKADNALCEFLTLSYLNGIAKYQPHAVNTEDPAQERARVKDRVFDALDTRSEPWRENPSGLITRKAAALSLFCVVPQEREEMDRIQRLYDTEEYFDVESHHFDNWHEDDNF